ncbi:MAG: hypothetical protein JWP58_2692 [Hymenobacter sp.]|nr:hypothetical protein [Hymenobacter sp.]
MDPAGAKGSDARTPKWKQAALDAGGAFGLVLLRDESLAPSKARRAAKAPPKKRGLAGQMLCPAPPSRQSLDRSNTNLSVNKLWPVLAAKTTREHPFLLGKTRSAPAFCCLHQPLPPRLPRPKPPPRLTQVLADTWATVKSLGWLDLPAALQRLARPWLALARDLARFVVQAEGALLRFLVQAVLGEQAAPVLKALDRGGELLLRILRHPLPFLQNLVAAGWRGFQNFLNNGPRHLLASVQDWLLGGLAKAGLHLPARLDMAGVIDLLLQVFKLTKTALLGRLRTRLVAVIGPENAARLEEVVAQVGGVALTLWQHGPAAAWQAISHYAGDLKDQALAFVQQQVLGVAARAVPVFLATLAVPGGAFVQVARGIYNGVMTFVEKGQQIAQVGTALLDSASAIAAGQLARYCV